MTTYLKKPVTLIRHRDDREFLAQIEAVDGLMNSMLAYPGRATLQIYQRLVQRNELAQGKIAGPNKVVDSADVRVPVMNVAGTSDVLVPVEVAHQVGRCCPTLLRFASRPPPADISESSQVARRPRRPGDDRRFPGPTSRVRAR